MADLDPSEYTINELKDELEEIDDPDTLHEILDTEGARKDRKGAREVIEGRLQAVEDVDGETVTADTESTGEELTAEDNGETEGRDSENNERTDNTGIIEIRNQIRENATELIGRELDGITEIQSNDEGWNAIVEVVERHSIPDTQDILGCYEIQLDADGTLRGYRRQRRYRRGDTALGE